MSTSVAALQCAALAEAADAAPELITACLLHDLGHLLNKADAPSDEGMDDAHQYAAISVWDWLWWRVALPLLIFVVFNVLYITTGFLYLSVVSV